MKILVSMLLFALLPAIACAQEPEPSKCVDREGRILITDEPCSTFKRPLGSDKPAGTGDKPLVEVPALPTPQNDASPSDSTAQSMPKTPSMKPKPKSQLTVH